MTATTSSEKQLKPRNSGKGPRERMASTASSIAMIVIGLSFLVPLLWVVLASFDTEASLSVQWPSRSCIVLLSKTKPSMKSGTSRKAVKVGCTME